MIAAMISKVIGLLYKSPLSSIVGNMEWDISVLPRTLI